MGQERWKTPASDHALSDRVIICDKQTVARSGEINNFVMNHNQKKKIINHSLPSGYSNHHNSWEPENHLSPDIFTGKNRYHDLKSVLLPGLFCLQAALIHTVSIRRRSKTLTRVTDNHWKIPVSSFYDCTFTMTIVKTYHNFQVLTYKAQLVGAANVIE